MLSSSRASPKRVARSSPNPRLWLGVSEGLQATKEALDAGQWQHAEAILRELLEFASADPKVWAWLGRVLEVQGRESEAKPCFEKAGALIQNQHEMSLASPASLALAKLLWQQHEKKGARLMLATLLSRTPDDDVLLQLSKQWSQATCR